MFLILKSYSWSPFFPVVSFAFGKKRDSDVIIFEKERTSRIKKITFNDFKDWINWRISTDRIYKIDSDFYSILISFDKNFWGDINENNDLIHPVYPWETKWIKFLEIDESRIEYLENLIKLYEKKINYYEKKKKR